MKIKLRSNGQVIDPPLRVAQRYIRLGRASIYEEPDPVKKPPKKPKKAKKAKTIEGKITKEKKSAPAKVSKGTGDGYSREYSHALDRAENSGAGNGENS